MKKIAPEIRLIQSYFAADAKIDPEFFSEQIILLFRRTGDISGRRNYDILQPRIISAGLSIGHASRRFPSPSSRRAHLIVANLFPVWFIKEQ